MTQGGCAQPAARTTSPSLHKLRLWASVPLRVMGTVGAGAGTWDGGLLLKMATCPQADVTSCEGQRCVLGVLGPSGGQAAPLVSRDSTDSACSARAPYLPQPFRLGHPLSWLSCIPPRRVPNSQ